jgi:serine/threonine-protein kinase SRPK3
MIELLGNFSKEFSLSTKQGKRYFNKNGKLRRIQGFHYWPIRSVLMEKYRIVETEARALEDFLLPMLIYEPEDRASAQKCLSHPWLQMPAVYEYHMTKQEHERLIEKQNLRLEAMQFKMQRNASGTPEKIRIPETVDADIEDNLSLSENEENEPSFEPSDVGFDENISYHDAMNKVRAELMDGKMSYH